MAMSGCINNITTWNVRGLNENIKRLQCLDFLRCGRISIAFLQGMHMRSSDVHRIQNKHYKVLAHSCAHNKTKGVVVLMDRRLDVTVGLSGSDSNGRFCFVFIALRGIKLCLASIYGRKYL